MRTSADAAAWSDWATVTDDDDMFDVDRNEHYGAPLPVSAGARFAQYRAWLPGGDASALARVGLTFMDVSDLNEGPLVTLLNDVRGAIAGLGDSYAAAAPVGASKVLTRQDWAADESLMSWPPEYKRVQKAIVHHTAGDDGGTNVAATIRAIYYFHAITRGWGDIGYNYLVDKYGNIWTGRAGGDHVIGGHAYGWNNGSVGVAAIGTYTSTSPTPAMVGAIANIIAMKFAQFGIAPYGADTFTHQEQRTDGTWVPVTSSPPNIQGHRDSNYIVGQNGGQTECPGNALWAKLPTIRSLAQTAVQNGYTNLVALEPNLPKAGLAGSVVPVQTTVFNRGVNPIPAGTAVSYKILVTGAPYVNQGGQGVIAAAIPPGAIGTATVPFTVPVIGNYMVRWDLQSGGSWWTALYNNPFRDMSFRSADWSADWVSDTVPKTWFSGQTTRVSVTITNDGGRPWPATGVNPVVLGYRWIDDATGRVTLGANFAKLGSDVQAGQTITLGIDVTAPMTASASYTMELDLYKQNEFWFKDKGIPADPTPTGVGPDYRATYQVGAVPPFQIGQTVAVPVTVTNVGLGVFPSAGATPVDLSYHWYDQSGKQLVWEGLRTKLPADLRPGQAVPLQAQVQSPPDGGTDQLRFDLVLEGVSWFSAHGTATGNVTATVCCAKTFGAQYQPQVTTLAVSGAGATVPIALTNTGNFIWGAGRRDAGPPRLPLDRWRRQGRRVGRHALELRGRRRARRDPDRAGEHRVPRRPGHVRPAVGPRAGGRRLVLEQERADVRSAGHGEPVNPPELRRGGRCERHPDRDGDAHDHHRRGAGHERVDGRVGSEHQSQLSLARWRGQRRHLRRPPHERRGSRRADRRRPRSHASWARWPPVRTPCASTWCRKAWRGSRARARRSRRSPSASSCRPTARCTRSRSPRSARAGRRSPCR